MSEFRTRLQGIGIGWLLALLGLVLVVVFWANGSGLSTDKELAMFALAFLAILL